MNERHMKPATVLEKVALHEAWLKNDPDGKQLRIRDVAISDVNLSRRDLRYAKFTNVTFENVRLDYTNLEAAELVEVTFDHVNLVFANLFKLSGNSTKFINSVAPHANFGYAQLNCCTITNSSFPCADLSRAHFNQSTITDTEIKDANLLLTDMMDSKLKNVSFKNSNLNAAQFRGASFDNVTGLPPIACPEKGGFIAYKAVSVSGKLIGAYPKLDAIAELYIPETAKRCSDTTRRCRCSRAKVIAFYNPKGNKIKATKAVSGCPIDAKCYTKGKYVKADAFDDDRWNHWAEGIQFVMTFDEAKELIRKD